KERRARELREISMQIELLREEVQRIEAMAEEVNNLIKASFSEGLLFRYRSLQSRKREILEKISQLELLKEEKRQRLKEAYRKLRALSLIKEQGDARERAKKVNLEAQEVSFLHLIKRWHKDV
ncbi:MAG: hypothetical protein ACK4OF_05510, partial [Aquificaceae bacterium]